MVVCALANLGGHSPWLRKRGSPPHRRLRCLTLKTMRRGKRLQDFVTAKPEPK